MRPPTSKQWLIGAGSLLAALVVTAVVVVVVIQPREASFARGSPEATVQAFLRALSQGDDGQALGYLAAEERQVCTVEKIRGLAARPLENARVTLERSRVTGDTADVTVLVIQDSGSPGFPGPGPGTYTRTEEYFLVKEEGQWRISSPAFRSGPWPLYNCRRPEPVPEPPEPVA